MTPAQKTEYDKILNSVMGQMIGIAFKYTLLNPNYNATTGTTAVQAKQIQTEVMRIPELHDFYARNPELLARNQTLMEAFKNSSSGGRSYGR